jgi:hypothetical protein
MTSKAKKGIQMSLKGEEDTSNEEESSLMQEDENR